MAKTETYRLLPDGPVLCDACTRTGSSIEMERDDSLPAEALKWSEEKNTELQSYRCPECESVSVFRVD
ncbi:hypothetical protein [Dyella sp. C11]|uniref:hypothetical protein n=1 Tax=Dyella sp. C11 TaxID=2126991 RepID=UPI000D652AD6|nr:hypothetical protein [Dyella sp. C11]